MRIAACFVSGLALGSAIFLTREILRADRIVRRWYR